MSDLPDRVLQAANRQAAFEGTGKGRYAVTTTPFDATVRVTADDPPRYAVEVRVPTLSAAVEGDVAPVVEEGWLETFERRLEDAAMPLAGTDDLAPAVTVEGDEVVVTAAVTDDDPERGAADARALVEYVEGTYLEGVVPGYDYRDPVASLRAEARQEYGE